MDASAVVVVAELDAVVSDAVVIVGAGVSGAPATADAGVSYVGVDAGVFFFPDFFVLAIVWGADAPDAADALFSRMRRTTKARIPQTSKWKQHVSMLI